MRGEEKRLTFLLSAVEEQLKAVDCYLWEVTAGLICPSSAGEPYSKKRNKTDLRENMRTIALLAGIVLLGGCGSQKTEPDTKVNDTEQRETSMTEEQQTKQRQTKQQQAKSALEIPFNTIEGQPTKLADFVGEVVLIVNVASECGYTPQYEGLQELYEKYHERGLTVIGFPANNFGGQEPGSDEEIRQFCTAKFSITFPMMSKVSVKGADQHPLFSFLTTESEPSGEIPWNFHKFLLDREGNIVARFNSDVTPLSAELTAKIESLL